MSLLAVLRPEPGNAATAARIEAAGRHAIRLPLFAVHPLAWSAPDPADFDALILTSANAVRHAGAGLAALARLSVFAVGEATADAAHRAGLSLAEIGDRDGAALLAMAEAHGVRRALLLGGRDRIVQASDIIAQAIAVYASDPLPVARAAVAMLIGSVALAHSPRAAARLAVLMEEAGVDRAAVRLAAISANAAAAAGDGWARIAIAGSQTDAALVAAALALAD